MAQNSDQSDAQPRVVWLGKDQAFHFYGENILIVDDNDVFLDVVQKGLSERGHRVTTVNNGWEACKEMFENEYDMIILDINMPQMDGLSTVKALRKSDSDTYILLVSGEAEEEKIHETLQSGANRFLAKPFSLNDLYAIVEEVDFMHIVNSKVAKREEQVQNVIRNNTWHRRLLNRLMRSDYRRNLAKRAVFAALVIAGCICASYLPARLIGQSHQTSENVLLEKMDQLTQAIRMDWGR